MEAITWTIDDIVKILLERQKNEFDANFVVTGARGNGKSSLISKILYRTGLFKPWTHQVYSRDEVIKLLKEQQYSVCFDDEAVNSGYKRNFQDKAQQELIKIVTAYRDNFNIYASAIPNFYSLDKDLRDMIFLHLHVIERGLALVFMPLENTLYSQDKWDTKNNARKEASWTEKIKRNPNFKPRFYELSTFRGYLYFNKLTPLQEQLYKEIKKAKRAEAFKFDDDKKDPKQEMLDKTYELLKKGELTHDTLLQVAYLQGMKYESLKNNFNKRLADEGINKKVRHLCPSKEEKVEDSKKQKVFELLGE